MVWTLPFSVQREGRKVGGVKKLPLCCKAVWRWEMYVRQFRLAPGPERGCLESQQLPHWLIRLLGANWTRGQIALFTGDSGRVSPRRWVWDSVVFLLQGKSISITFWILFFAVGVSSKKKKRKKKKRKKSAITKSDESISCIKKWFYTLAESLKSIFKLPFFSFSFFVCGCSFSSVRYCFRSWCSGFVVLRVCWCTRVGWGHYVQSIESGCERRAVLGLERLRWNATFKRKHV